MKIFGVGYFALGICTLATTLQACEAALPVGARGAVAPRILDRMPLAHSDSLLYVAEGSGRSVLIYNARAKDPAPESMITEGLNFPQAVCIDGAGTVYVTNQPASGPGWVSEYPAGKTKPSKMITKGINSPAFCAIDSKGNLWIANLSGPSVTAYKPGSAKPFATITKGMIEPVGIAIDHSDNMYVSNGLLGSAQNVVVFSAGSKSPSRTITDGVMSPVGITVDAKGTLYVTNISQNNVQEYLVGQSDPYQTITRGMDKPAAVTVNRAGRLYVSNVGDNSIVEFPPRSIQPSSKRIGKDLYFPLGSAYSPPLLP